MQSVAVVHSVRNERIKLADAKEFSWEKKKKKKQHTPSICAAVITLPPSARCFKRFRKESQTLQSCSPGEAPEMLLH